MGRIRSGCAEYGLKEPTIEEFGDGFRVIFYRKVVSADQNVGSSETMTTDIAQKVGSDPEKMGSTAQKVSSNFAKYEAMLVEAGITKIFIVNIESVFQHAGRNAFKQSDVMEYLSCSKSKAGNVMNAMRQAGVIKKAAGMGLGKYQFV